MTNHAMLGPIADMLKAAGCTTDDLVAFTAAAQGDNGHGPTLAEYIVKVRRTLSKNTDDSYKTHYNHFINGLSRQCECTCEVCLAVWAKSGTCDCTCPRCEEAVAFPAMGDRVITPGAFSKTELVSLVKMVQQAATKRAMVQNQVRAKRRLSAKPTHGQGAREMCVTALRCLFEAMLQDELISKNPAAKISKGRRSTSLRRAISDAELATLMQEVATGGDDPLLDLAVTWAEFELGARRDGILRMTVGQLDHTGQIVRLWEKENRFRPQPCSADLINFLLNLAAQRSGSRCIPGSPDFNPNAAVFYFKDSTPKKLHDLTGRRFDTLHKRVQLALPWANSISYTGHALRHTVGTMVERIAGFETAKAMLGHSGDTPTDIYAKARLPEVARVMAEITGKPHPLASAEDSN